MSGYVFHCTPCGNAHAGECPPKAKGKSLTDAQMSGMLDHIEAELGKLLVPSQYVRSGHAFIPHVGTKWIIEDFDFVSGAWVPRVVHDPNLHYVVKAVTPPLVVVDTMSAPLPPWEQEIEMDAFLDTGHMANSSKFRMVFKP